MEIQTRLLRYVVPGSLFLFGAVGVWAYLAVSVANEPIESTLSVFEDASAILVGAALIIPVGFLVFQAYYWSHRPTYSIGRIVFVTEDRAAEVFRRLPKDFVARLRTLMDARLDVDCYSKRIGSRNLTRWLWRTLHIRRLDLAALESKYAFVSEKDLSRVATLSDAEFELEHPGKSSQFLEPRPARRTYANNHRENWYALDGLVQTVMAGDRADSLANVLVERNSMIHSLGACRVALPSGWIGGILIFIVWRFHESPTANFAPSGGFLIHASIAMAVGLCLFFVVQHSRQKVWSAFTKLASNGVRAAIELDPHVCGPSFQMLSPDSYKRPFERRREI